MTRRIGIIAVSTLIGAIGFSAATHAEAQELLSHARAACASAGLTPSEAPFTYCVEAAEQRYKAAAPNDDVVRAQQVCGAMGYAGEAYAACVGNVDQTLFDQQNFLTR